MRYKKTKKITLKEYCPDSKYPDDQVSLIRLMVRHEDERRYKGTIVHKLPANSVVEAQKPNKRWHLVFKQSVEKFIGEFAP